MAVESSDSQVSYDCDGSTTVFPVPFYFQLATDLTISLLASDGTITPVTSGYEVAGAGTESGGSVTTDTVYATGRKIVISRVAPLTQEVRYQSNNAFPAKTQEKAYDKLTMIAQQHQRSISRSIQFPDADISGASVILPAAAARASKTLIFDQYGNSLVSNEAYVEPSVAADNAKHVAEQLDSALPLGSGLGAFIQDGVGSVAQTFQQKMRAALSMSDQAGVDKTGATAMDTQFGNQNTFMVSQARATPAGISSGLVGGQIQKIEPGAYLLTKQRSFLNGYLWGSVTQGIAVEGQGGPGSVIIDYNPATPGDGPLIANPNKLLFARIKNIRFFGRDATSGFWSSNSSGSTQDCGLEDCLIEGNWLYGIGLSGSNTNSEWKFNRLSITGNYAQGWLYSPAVGASGSDQFLNYWFLHTKDDSQTALVDMSSGGHVKVRDSDMSGYSPAGPSMVYKFNMRVNTHARGVMMLDVSGLRVEQKTQYAAIANIRWGGGNVNFRGFDFASQASNAYAAALVGIALDPGNNPGSHLALMQGQYMGQLSVNAGTRTFGTGRVTIDSVDFVNYPYPDDAIIQTETGSQQGNRTVVRMRGVRGDTTVPTFADADKGWHVAAVGHTSQKTISLKSAFGTLPSFADAPTGLSVALPLNAALTEIMIAVEPNGTSIASCSYTVQDGEGTVLATLNLAPLSSGGVVTINTWASGALTLPYKRLRNRLQSTLYLIPSSTVNAASPGLCLFKYLG